MPGYRKIPMIAALLAGLNTPVAATAQTASDGAVSSAVPTVRQIVQGLDMGARGVIIDASEIGRINVRIGGAIRDVLILPRHAVDLTIGFAYNSAVLSQRAKAQIDTLARTLLSPRLRSHRFLIAGHTDARGDASYNARLSLARARAVKTYLVEIWGIRADRLVTHGWGESDLKNPALPFDAANRRVEIVALVDGPLAAVSTADESQPAATDNPTLNVTVDVAPTGCADGLRDPRPATMDLDDFGGSSRSRRCMQGIILKIGK